MMNNPRNFLNGSSRRFGTGPRPIGAGGALLGQPGPIRGMAPNPVLGLVPPTCSTRSPLRDVSTEHLQCSKCKTAYVAGGGCGCNPNGPANAGTPSTPQTPAQPSTPSTTPSLPGPSFGPPAQQQQPPQAPPQQPPRNWFPPQQPGQAQPSQPQPAQPGLPQGVPQPGLPQGVPQPQQPSGAQPGGPTPAHFVPQPGLPQSVPSQPGLSHAVPGQPIGVPVGVQPQNPPGVLTNHATPSQPGTVSHATPQPRRPGYGLGDGIIAEPRLGVAGAWTSTKNWWEGLPTWKKWLYGGLAVAVPVTGVGIAVASSGSHDGAHEGPDRDELGRFTSRGD